MKSTFPNWIPEGFVVLNSKQRFKLVIEKPCSISWQWDSEEWLAVVFVVEFRSYNS